MSFMDFLKGARSLASEVKAIRTEIEDKKRRRDELRTLPLPKEEVARLVGEYIDSKKIAYQSALKATLHPFLRENPLKPQEALLMHGSHSLRFLTCAGDGQQGGHHHNIEPALIAILGDTFKSGVMAEIDRLEWPKCGPCLKDRESELAELDRAIAKLEEQRSELDAKINQAQQELNQ